MECGKRKIVKFIIFLNFYLFLRERERERDRDTDHKQGRDRERGRHNPKQAPDSELSAQSPMQGLNPQTTR